MDDREITDLLERVRAKLGEATRLTDGDRELLTRLASDLESLLARGGEIAAQHRQSLMEQLEDSITRFEVSHPDLTNLLARVSKTLGDMGI